MKRKINGGRSLFGVTLMVAGGVFILSAASLFLYNTAEDNRASAAALSIADELSARIEERAETARNADDAPAPVVTAGAIYIDGETYIGVLRIPALNLSLPVMNDWSYDRLKISPCRYSGSAEDNTMVIAAHNYRRHFGSIHLLPYGSEMTFTDADGNTILYAIAEIETLEATDIKGMSASDYDLTLFTCTYGGAARLAVRCDRLPF
jgi:sortase A